MCGNKATSLIAKTFVLIAGNGNSFIEVTYWSPHF